LPNSYPLRVYCRVLGVSRAGYYANQSRGVSARQKSDDLLLVQCKKIHIKSARIFGAPKVKRGLAMMGIRVGQKRVARLMKAAGLAGVCRRKKYRNVGACPKGKAPAKNWLNRQFTATAPDQKWVCDTTELRAGGERLFLAAIMDLFSRRIVGWSWSRTNDEDLVRAALTQALMTRSPSRTLVHSDQGSPYASLGMQKYLRLANKECSMSRRGNCWDNAPMESWFGILKSELGSVFQTVREADNRLFAYIEEFYNRERFHSTINYQTPVQFELAFHKQHKLKMEQPMAARDRAVSY
jgi:putative transposase